MTRKKDNAKGQITAEELRQFLAADQDLLKMIVEQTVQQVLEAEMTEALQAGKSERTEARLGYRAGYYPRLLITRVGKIELRVPQDRQGRFRTEVFERYQRSEKALVAAMLEMYVQGVSTRKVKTITEELCGHEFSSATISRMVQQLDAELEKFARRRLEEPYPYLILVLLCHKYTPVQRRLGVSGTRQQGQCDSRVIRATMRRARMVAMECGLCRSVRTGSAPRLETLG
jgi:putative transposase